MEAKEYLSRYYYYDLKANNIKAELDRAYEEADTIKSVSDNDGMPHGTKIGHPTEEKAIRIADLTRQLEELYAEAKMNRLEIFITITKVSGEKQNILKYRYVDLMAWDTIADIMSYSIQHIFKLHGDALEDVQDMLDKAEHESK